MSSIIKTIVILIILAAIGFGVYFYFFKPDTATPATTSVPVATTQVPGTSTPSTPTPTTAAEQNFLTILLSVRKITLNQEIFKNPAFATLQNSTIELIPDGNEGRPNPFAPIGTDPIVSASTADTISASGTDINAGSADFILPIQNTPSPKSPTSNIVITPNKTGN